MPEKTVIRWEPVLPRPEPRGELDATWRWKVVVGRARECDVVLKHGSIPARQGQLLRLRNYWCVEDLREGNGIYIDGRRINFEPIGQRTVDFSMIARLHIEKIPVTPEEQRLRDAITAAPDSDASFLVYADWLQEQGHELGQLMVSPAPIGARWLGPLYGPGLAVTWRHGFLDSIKVRSAASVPQNTGVFSEVICHPLSAFLRTLEVDAVLLSQETDHISPERWAGGLLETLEAEPTPATLRDLKIRLPWEKRLGLEAAFIAAKKKLPQLQTTWETLFTEGALP